jgi:hypothetical protein
MYHISTNVSQPNRAVKIRCSRAAPAGRLGQMLRDALYATFFCKSLPLRTLARGHRWNTTTTPFPTRLIRALRRLPRCNAASSSSAFEPGWSPGSALRLSGKLTSSEKSWPILLGGSTASVFSGRTETTWQPLIERLRPALLRKKQPCELGPVSKLLWPDSRAYRFDPWKGSLAGIPKSRSALANANHQHPKRNQISPAQDNFCRRMVEVVGGGSSGV